MKNYCGKHTLEEEGVIKTHDMEIFCYACSQRFHTGEYLVILRNEEKSMLKILCRDIQCKCGELHRAVPVIFKTLKRAQQESRFISTRPYCEGLDWRTFWEYAPALQNRQ